MKQKFFILILLALSTALLPVRAQDSDMLRDTASDLERARFYARQAKLDASYEHQLQFTHPQDEIDFWNDQRRFEQELSKSNLIQYHVYRAAKKQAYLEHTQVCRVSCGHGDYYVRQASLYLQFDAEDTHPYMTFSEVKRGRGWQISYLPIQNKPK